MRECSWKCYAIYNKDTSDITLYRLPTLVKQFSSNFNRYIFFSIAMLQTAWFWLGVTITILMLTYISFISWCVIFKNNTNLFGTSYPRLFIFTFDLKVEMTQCESWSWEAIFNAMASFQQKIRDIIRSPFVNKGLPLMVMLLNINKAWKRFVHVVVMCRISTKSIVLLSLLSSLLRWVHLFPLGIYVIRGSYTCTDTKDDLQEEGQEEICCRSIIKL